MWHSIDVVGRISTIEVRVGELDVQERIGAISPPATPISRIDGARKLSSFGAGIVSG
ncbi:MULTISPECIES: hypothetical protein [Tessaracoccus]|uniref:hypothetical protein n=1 Tax=Tessaracoccus TaxID=72763 RepID=UPI0012946930|nr:MULTISPECIES: hypothetical protein [Tessaracoccus]